MTTMIACGVAVISTISFLLLWFWVVHRELQAKLNTVESAKIQLAVYRERKIRSQDEQAEMDINSVLERSFDILCQAVKLYNQTLQKAQNKIPGFLMGFDRLDEPM